LSRRVLVVDDDSTMVATLCDVLALHGWEPIPAYDGVEAVRLAQTGWVDIVVMDIRMPRLDGAEALRAIKAKRPELPVILVTAMASDATLDVARKEGALRILDKPLDLPLLLEVLESAA
jgi:CheY-like chemotaxis protein